MSTMKGVEELFTGVIITLLDQYVWLHESSLNLWGKTRISFRVNCVCFEVKEIPLAVNKCEIRIKHQRVVIFLLLRGKCRNFIFQSFLLCEPTFALHNYNWVQPYPGKGVVMFNAGTHVQKPRADACRILITEYCWLAEEWMRSSKSLNLIHMHFEGHWHSWLGKLKEL